MGFELASEKTALIRGPTEVIGMLIKETLTIHKWYLKNYGLHKLKFKI